MRAAGAVASIEPIAESMLPVRKSHFSRAIVTNILVLALAICILAVSRAGASDLQFTVAPALEVEAFQELAVASAQEEAPERLDPALTQASYHSQQRYASSGQRSGVRVGYEGGFVIGSPRQLSLHACDAPFLLRINGWGQLRHTNINSAGTNPNANQFQLKRARLIFAGHAFTPDFTYFSQLDGRSSSGDDVRLLDYFMTYDLGHHAWGLSEESLVFKTGKYKIPFTMARYLSGREFEFSDRSVASTFFDVNRSLAWGLYGLNEFRNRPWDWELAVFNGLVTGGAETGSSGALDNNFAYSGRSFIYPTGEWGEGELADFEVHETLATRAGVAFAISTIESSGETEFNSVRVVDSGENLSTLLDLMAIPVDEYTVNLYSIDFSSKFRGWSFTYEYYFRLIDEFDNAAVPDLFDHGFWLQLGKFVIPNRLQLIARWSRVAGDSGTLGSENQSAEEIAGGAVWYFRDQHSKVVFDTTFLDGAPINSSALDIAPGEKGWLFRTQVQFAF